MGNPIILIVDDEQETRKTLNEYLSRRIKCDIVEAENGYEAIARLGEHAIDLVLLDIKMPGISGTEVIKKVQEGSKGTAVIVMTKWDSSEISARLEKMGVEYIPKPFSLKVVQTKVEEKLKAKGKFLLKQG